MSQAVTTPAPVAIITKRKLLLRDSLTFLALFAITAVLFGVTLFLFHTFEDHREDLARRWSDRGQEQLREGRPEEAVTSLRAALSYAPDERPYQLLLAQALASAGRIDQAMNYFLNLWAARPGDGFINLQLARLARRKGDPQQAIDYYRAAIFGDWQGDGLTRRREARLELIDYFMERHDVTAARAELLIASGNAPNDPRLNVLFGDKFVAIGDLVDALAAYRKAMILDPRNGTAFEDAGRVAYTLGDYASARGLLRRALEEDRAVDAKAREAGRPGTDGEHFQALAALEHNASRLVELSLSRELPARERASHILLAWSIAQARLDACSAKLAAAGLPGAANSQPDALQTMKTNWQAAAKAANRTTLAENASAEDNMTQLIFNAELQTEELCGEPSGDDALLLLLAGAHGASEPQTGAPE